MRLLTWRPDERIGATSFFIELSVKEYLDIVRITIDANDLQRKRVKSPNTVYSLLKKDLETGCTVPPIVLALDRDVNPDDFQSDEDIEQLMNNGRNGLIILDGLQRTFTMLDLEEELQSDEHKLSHFYTHNVVIVELYIGINRLGILYRTLTLNTGQTPMSLRHQIEILYLDLLNKDVDGIKLVRESEEDGSKYELGVYRFRDVIDGYTSYLERDELPLTRFDLLENIKSLEKLSKENSNGDLFEAFIKTYNAFVMHINTLATDWEFDEDNAPFEVSGQPFGKSVWDIFSRSQAITGFGAAVGKLREFGLVNSFDDVFTAISNIHFLNEPSDGLYELLRVLDRIKLTSKKIGNSQRMFFQYFFRDLFNRESDFRWNFDSSIDTAYKKYRSQME